MNSKTINPQTNYRRYRYYRFLSSVGSWSVDRGAHIQAFTLKLSGSRSVACGARIQAFTFLLTKTLSRSRSVVDCAHIRAFTFLSQDHGRLSIARISEHSLFRLKITVGCQLCAYPSIHTKTCRHVGLHGPRGKHAGCGHVHPC